MKTLFDDINFNFNEISNLRLPSKPEVAVSRAVYLDGNKMYVYTDKWETLSVSITKATTDTIGGILASDSSTKTITTTTTEKTVGGYKYDITSYDGNGIIATVVIDIDYNSINHTNGDDKCEADMVGYNNDYLLFFKNKPNIVSYEKNKDNVAGDIEVSTIQFKDLSTDKTSGDYTTYGEWTTIQVRYDLKGDGTYFDDAFITNSNYHGAVEGVEKEITTTTIDPHSYVQVNEKGEAFIDVTVPQATTEKLGGIISATDDKNTAYKYNIQAYHKNFMDNMFSNTGGDNIGTPSLNTEYYIEAPKELKGCILIEHSSNTMWTFISNSDATLEYSFDDSTYFSVTKGTAIGVSDKKLYLRGTGNTTGNTTIGGNSSTKYFDIECSSNDFKVSGNILNLLDYTNNPTSMNNFAFAYLFYNNTCISDCSELILPEFTGNWCYQSMFYGCTNLSSAPELPTTKLASNCYNSMFYGCTSLSSAPELPATTINSACYHSMFYGCTSLTSAPALPATSLPSYCYYRMFYGCTSIKLSTTKTDEYNIEYRIPSSGTGTIANSWSLIHMFTNTGGTFTGTPEINTTYYTTKATSTGTSPDGAVLIQSLSENEHINILINSNVNLEYSFDNSSWNTLKSGESIITPGNGVYTIYLRGTGNTNISNLFKDNNSLYSSTGNIKISGNILNLLDYQNNPTNMANTAFNQLFLNNTYIKDCSELILPKFTSDSCYYQMFSGCTSLTSAPALPATSLADYCYGFMFSGCTSLTSAPALPATSLAYSCYNSMFQRCTSLTSAPELPATSLANSCYESMFQGCTSLTSAPELPATTLADWCYNSMFQGCTSLTSAPELPAKTLAEYCYNSMFSGCTSLNLYNSSQSAGSSYTTYTISATIDDVDITITQDTVLGTACVNQIPNGWSTELGLMFDTSENLKVLSYEKTNSDIKGDIKFGTPYKPENSSRYYIPVTYDKTGDGSVYYKNASIIGPLVTTIVDTNTYIKVNDKGQAYIDNTKYEKTYQMYLDFDYTAGELIPLHDWPITDPDTGNTLNQEMFIFDNTTVYNVYLNNLPVIYNIDYTLYKDNNNLQQTYDSNTKQEYPSIGFKFNIDLSAGDMILFTLKYK